MRDRLSPRSKPLPSRGQGFSTGAAPAGFRSAVTASAPGCPSVTLPRGSPRFPRAAHQPYVIRLLPRHAQVPGPPLARFTATGSISSASTDRRLRPGPRQRQLPTAGCATTGTPNRWHARPQAPPASSQGPETQAAPSTNQLAPFLNPTDDAFARLLKGSGKH
jgi:hypothetical protein